MDTPMGYAKLLLKQDSSYAVIGLKQKRFIPC